MIIYPLIDPYAVHFDSFDNDIYTLDTAGIQLTEGSIFLGAGTSYIGNGGPENKRPLVYCGTGVLHLANCDEIFFENGSDPVLLNFYDAQREFRIVANGGGTASLYIQNDLEVTGTCMFGNEDDYLGIEFGVVMMDGDAKRLLTLRPDFDHSIVSALGKPTIVTVGLFQGFSLPIYSADNEELFMNFNVPGRWEGISDIEVDIIVALSQAETANDDFKLQLSWQNSATGFDTTSVILDQTGHDVEVETNIPAERNAQYDTYTVTFIIDWDIDSPNIVAHDAFTMRLRRIAADGTEIAGEVIVIDAHCHFIVDKMFKAP